MADPTLFLTGASSDIGVALIRKTFSEDPESLVLAHSFSGAARLQALREEYGDARLMLIEGDLRDHVTTTALITAIQEYGTPLKFVHLSALKLRYERFPKLDWDRFTQDSNVQLRSAVLILQALLPKMAKQSGARVVFVLSSVTLGMPPKFMSAYTIAKFAQLGLMRALAAEYAATKVRINAISPAMVETQFLDEIGDVAREMSAAANPLGRNAKPDDLLGALSLLLGSQSEFIHGVNLPITAGMGC